MNRPTQSQAGLLIGHRSLRHLLLGLFLLLFCSTEVLANWWEIPRRRPQEHYAFDYAIAPFAMNMPGIGTAYGVAGATNNLFSTEADLFYTLMRGDMAGTVMGMTDFPILSKHLTLNYFQASFEKVSLDMYRRGMESDPLDYTTIRVKDMTSKNAMVNLKFWDKRIQLYQTQSDSAMSPDAVLDQEGNVLFSFQDGSSRFETSDQGLLLDYTDDRSDPRKGIRFEMRKADNLRTQDTDPYYYRLDKALTFYLPSGDNDSLALNYYASDAVVTQEGFTDLAQIESDLEAAYGCSLLTGEAQTLCLTKRSQAAGETWATNKYGTASSLGGAQFLRSYPQGRFFGAHSRFMGLEYRLNLNEDRSPYDVFFAKGVRTINQISLFAEQGTVADLGADLGKVWRHSYGLGFRMILLSGMVFRIDWATGEEGAQTTVFINYPWGIFL